MMANVSGGQPKPATTRMRQRVVRLWNTDRYSMSQIGEQVGITRGVVGRMLAEARKAGMDVLSVGAAQRHGTANSAQDTLRQRLGEAVYCERMLAIRKGRHPGLVPIAQAVERLVARARK